MKTDDKTVADLAAIGAALHQAYENYGGMTLRKLADISSLSVNSIKSIFQGGRANIANYDALARALDTSLVQVIQATFTVQPKAPVENVTV